LSESLKLHNYKPGPKTQENREMQRSRSFACQSAVRRRRLFLRRVCLSVCLARHPQKKRQKNRAQPASHVYTCQRGLSRAVFEAESAFCSWCFAVGACTKAAQEGRGKGAGASNTLTCCTWASSIIMVPAVTASSAIYVSQRHAAAVRCGRTPRLPMLCTCFTHE